MTPPDALAGFALIALVWFFLWWAAGRFKALTWRAHLAAALALATLASKRADLLLGVSVVVQTWAAATRYETERTATDA